MNYEWMLEAKKHLGAKEIPGKNHNPVILNWLKELKAWWMDDETPWCGVYVAHCFRVANIEIPKLYMRASEWNSWGVGLDRPIEGCVVTFTRQGGGHVGFVVGESTDGYLLVLGGNQGNSVNVAKFDKSRVTSYRWPKIIPIPEVSTLPKVASISSISTNEA